MGSGASIYSEQLYLVIDTSRLSSDESIAGNESIDTFLTTDSMDSDLFLSEDALGCFGRFYKSVFWALLQKRVLGTFSKVLGITQVEYHQRQVDGHANQACHDE